MRSDRRGQYVRLALLGTLGAGNVLSGCGAGSGAGPEPASATEQRAEKPYQAARVPDHPATFPVVDDFSSQSPDWLLSGTAQITNGVLRLTEAVNDVAGSGIYNRPFSSTLGVTLQFDYYSDDGSGADGISFFLVDGSVDTPELGAYGGSLGYIYGPSAPGLTKAYMGVGFDEFGNFLNNGYFHDGLGFTPQHVGIRGSSSKVPSTEADAEYDYIVGSGVDVSEYGGIDGGWRTASLTVYQNQRVSLCMSWDGGKSYHKILDKLDFRSQNDAAGYLLPPTFKLGFSGSTGGSTNRHELDNLKAALPVDLSVGFVDAPVGEVLVGDPVHYVLRLSNDGPYADPHSRLDVTVPEGLADVTWRFETSSGETGSGAGSSIAADLHLNVGESAVFTVEAVVGPGAKGQDQTVSATFTPSQGYADPCPDGTVSTKTKVSDNTRDDLDGDGIPNSEDLDDDGDGLSDADEIALGSDPNVADHDGDGVLDPADEDDDNDGIPDQVECGAGALSLINGSFEDPHFSSGVNFALDENVPGWETTASDNTMEFWSATNPAAAVGHQFVELNAYQVSTLYQDVPTTPGASYFYRFYHRGRSGEDTLAFKVGTSESQTEIRRVTTGNSAWQLVSGVYTVPQGQTTTRFAYESVSASGGSPSVGNFLDGISFTPGCRTDSDEDGLIDAYDTDSDNDGLPDGVEAGHGLADSLGVAPAPYGSNGLSDPTEDETDSGNMGYPLADSDGDEQPDYVDPDSDNDGLTDAEEQELGTDPRSPDTDDDGVSDKDELTLGTNPRDADNDDDGIIDFADDDDDNDGIPDVVECGSSSLSLINGSFEVPPATVESFSSYPEDEVPGWDTTATDNIIELMGPGFEGHFAAVGSQFAELNATQPSRLYQDVLTVPGATYLYRFYHKGRFGEDTMSFKVGAPGDEVEVRQVSTANQAWQLVSGLYTVPEGQTLTRFAYESISSVGGAAAGNFLDGITFTPGCKVDTDEDGVVEPYDTDSDSDGLPDGVEAGHDRSDVAGYVSGPYGDNGLADSVETSPDSSSPNYTVADSDDDGIYDFQEWDADNDGLDDIEEVGGGTNPRDPDTDDDGYLDGEDNCPLAANPAQLDTDGDGQGNACDGDDDGDGVIDELDNCSLEINPDQADLDDDGTGDLCDDDIDGDGAENTDDCAPLDGDVYQESTWYQDQDNDGYGDPDGDLTECLADAPNGYVDDNTDNCPDDKNGDQADLDEDELGDECDDDVDGDGVDAVADCDDYNGDAFQILTYYADVDEDGYGDSSTMQEECVASIPSGTVSNGTDNCITTANPDQADLDKDGQGDACDSDKDGDTVENDKDNCPAASNTDQADEDLDGQGKACDDQDEPWRVEGGAFSCSQSGSSKQAPVGALSFGLLSALFLGLRSRKAGRNPDRRQ